MSDIAEQHRSIDEHMEAAGEVFAELSEEQRIAIGGLLDSIDEQSFDRACSEVQGLSRTHTAMKPESPCEVKGWNKGIRTGVFAGYKSGSSHVTSLLKTIVFDSD